MYAREPRLPRPLRAPSFPSFPIIFAKKFAKRLQE